MENMDIFNQVKEVPAEAKKEIKGGRLKGMTDIKPMWRIQKLTEVFGACGIGWKAPIVKKEIIEGANGEKVAIVDIQLFYKVDGQWSEPVDGTGGSSFVTSETKGLYTSDECFKMAYTDALSVACKSIGMGAEVYWGDSKYIGDDDKDKKPTQPTQPKNTNLVTSVEAKSIYDLMVRKGLKVVDLLKQNYGIDNTSKLTKEQFKSILDKCNTLPDKK